MTHSSDSSSGRSLVHSPAVKPTPMTMSNNGSMALSWPAGAVEHAAADPRHERGLLPVTGLLHSRRKEERGALDRAKEEGRELS
jgi:hypothetical protein